MKIMERYMSFCTDAGKRDELLRRFTAMESSHSAKPSPPGEGSKPSAGTSSKTFPGTSSKLSTGTSLELPLRPSTGTASDRPSIEVIQSPANTKALEQVMMALRKLREGIVASKRVDEFTVQVYLFCIRLSVLVKHPESYHPAILYLLRTLHRQSPLTNVEYQEVVGYLVLDTACRRQDLAEAYSLRHQHKLRDKKVNLILSALTHDNYILFRKIHRSVDGHKARLMEFAIDDVRMRTLKAFGRAYFSVEKEYLEIITGKPWDLLRSEDGCGWENDGDKIVIRRVKR